MPRLHNRKNRSSKTDKKIDPTSLTNGTEPARKENRQQMSPAEKAILGTVLNQETVYADLPLNQIQIDMSYQDRPRKTLVELIATQFSEVMLGNLVVSKRADGTYWVVDGATRKLGLEGGGHHNRMVRCQIICTTSVQQEALLFKHFNCNRKLVPIANRLNAEGIAGINGLRDAVAECGFQLVGSGKRTLKGPYFLVDAYNLDDGVSLKKALFSFKACWDGQHRLDGGNVKGLSLLFYSQPRSVDAQVRNYLSQKGPDDIERLVQTNWSLGGRNKANARMHPSDRAKFVAKALACEINRRTRKTESKLDISRLNKMFFPDDS